MGRQINFFAAASDIKMIANEVLSNGDFILREDGSKIINVDELVSGKFYKVFIWRDGLKLYIKERVGINYRHSEVIEFVLCEINSEERKMWNGRLWYERFYYEGYDKKTKSEALDKMYDRYKKFIVKNFRRGKIDKWFLIGPAADALRLQGWRMMNGPMTEIEF